MTTSMPPAVRRVELRARYVLRLTFESGEIGELDVSPYLDFGVFSRLKAPGAFQAVRVAFNTVEWECGIDLDPEFVYHKCRMLAE